MNISAFTIYLWQLADTLVENAKGATFGFLVAGLIALCLYFAAKQDGKDTAGAWKKWSNRFFAVTTIVFLVATFTPSSKTIAMMVVIPAIANSELVQRDIPELYKAAIGALKEKVSQE